MCTEIWESAEVEPGGLPSGAVDINGGWMPRGWVTSPGGLEEKKTNGLGTGFSVSDVSGLTVKRCQEALCSPQENLGRRWHQAIRK